MKNSIKHLPQNKQQELKQIVDIILQNCSETEIIILFGSYARGGYKEEKDLKEDRKSGHVSDYDILVVTKDKEIALNKTLWNKVSKECRNLKLSADPRILTHDIQALNIKLAEGQYFYTDITKEGIVLYDSQNCKLAYERQLTGKEQQRIAKDHFEKWFFKANAFFEDFESNLKKSLKNQEYLSIAAFDLHQAVEHAYKAIFLVFTDYCPHEHMLDYLIHKTKKYHPDLKNLFPQNTKEEENRFELFEYAYIGGRYDPEYYISQEDLEILAMDVKKLLTITEKICKKKIKSLDCI